MGRLLTLITNVINNLQWGKHSSLFCPERQRRTKKVLKRRLQLHVVRRRKPEAETELRRIEFPAENGAGNAASDRLVRKSRSRPETRNLQRNSDHEVVSSLVPIARARIRVFELRPGANVIKLFTTVNYRGNFNPRKSRV